MNRSMRRFLLGLALIASLSLVACANTAAILTASSWPGMTVEGDTIYLASGQRVYAINAETTFARWRYPLEVSGGGGITGGRAFYAPPAVTEDKVIITDFVDNLVALDRETGTELWIYQTNGERSIGGPIIEGDTIYLGDSGGVLHAVDLDSGEPIWTFAPEGTRGIWARPTIEDGILYYTSLDRHLYAVDAESGEMLWRFPEGDEDIGAMAITPLVLDGVVYFGTFFNELYALDLETQEVLWTYEATNWVWAQPIYDAENDLIISGDLDGQVFALERDSGELVWNFEILAGQVVESPVLVELSDPERRLLFVTSGTSQQNLHLLNPATGEPEERSVTLEGDFTTSFLFFPNTSERAVPVYTAPIIYNNVILLAAHQGDFPLYALDIESLVEAWHFDPQPGN
ncbi:MAG: PQQ-binding-like beta-propeller repeat protein [Chloroflexi bacterium]|nr:PQQ-binding-like beta-propeller repeat protein [Chloroflexota bacterium]